MLLLLYVDDTLISAIDQTTINTLKKDLHSMYKMTEEGVPKLFLSIELDHQPNEIRLHQRRYINSILKKFGIENCKPVVTPLLPKAKFSRDNDEPLNTEERVSYKLLIGILMYLIVCYRLDLVYTMSILSKYLNKPTREHLRAAKYVLRYLNKTVDLELVYKRRSNNNNLVRYINTDWTKDFNDRQLTSKYVFILNDTVIS